MIRVLQDPPLDGPTNMARDEALMKRVGAGASPPTLRLYQWDPPAISLGYFQRYAEYESLPPPAGRLTVVRRLTGGGAILHDRELTYSLVLPATHPLAAYRPSRLYELVHDAVRTSLTALGLTVTRCGAPPPAAGGSSRSGPARGPFFCFDRRHPCDLLIGERKIAGSAQRRTHQGILQHGSIILATRYEQQQAASISRPFAQAVVNLRAAFVAHLKDSTRETFEPGEWSQAELSVTGDLIRKYTSNAWTQRS